MALESNIESTIPKGNPPDEVSLRIAEENVHDYIRREMLAMAPIAIEVIKRGRESRKRAKAREVAVLVLEQVSRMGAGETSREAKRVLKEWRSRRRNKPIPPVPEATPATPQGVE